MNQTQSYMDVHGSHLSAVSSAAAISNYHQYHHQPPVLQPASTAYGPASSYSQYGYHNGVASSQSVSQPPTSSMTSQISSQLVSLPALTTSLGPPVYGNDSVYDTTGQLAPPGAKPRVTATLWEDEGSLCYQIEARGVCVARREDNHMINGTKLLNVAGMTRGRRDGILKSEKIRNVVKIGPMHLKGVWIPFERALDFANKEKITDLLYPLFVHQIAELLYHPTNSSQTNMVVQDSQQRRLEGPQSRAPQIPPTLHHHMQSHLPPHLSQSSNISAQTGIRPAIDRTSSFPTPPASTSGLIGMSHSGSYDWNNQSMSSGISNSQPLSIESTSLGSARSVPTTPATTPPGNGLQGMPPFQSQSTYDSAKSYYSAAHPSNSQYPTQPLTQPAMVTYGHPSLAPGSYIKGGITAAGRPAGQSETDVTEGKGDRYNSGASRADDPVSGHGSEYGHDSSSAYSSRGSYTYTSNTPVGALAEQPQLTPEMTGSPSQTNNSGRITPRSSGGGLPSQWPSGYSTPQRPAAGSLYNIVSDTRGSSANGAPPETYGVSASTPGYSTAMNGSIGIKRLRDDDDNDRIGRPDSRGIDYETKRRKTITDSIGPVGGAALALHPVKAGGVMARTR